jgi:hypothetical protein
VTEVVVLHRRVGALTYQSSPARSAGERRWRAAIKLDGARRAYALEYYVEARGPGGGVVARIATPDAPLALEISPGGGEGGGRPWYGRWYVIAGAAAVAAGTTGAIIIATDGPSDGTLPPGRVTVSP